MAHHKSAKKRIKTNQTKRDRNSSFMSTVRTAIRKLTKSLEGAVAPQEKEVASSLSAAQSLLDRAAKRGIIHKNHATRRVTRLSAQVKKALSK